MLTALARLIREHREYITRKVTVLEENYSPTYGPGEPHATEIEVIDIDRLLEAIDELGEELRERVKP